MLSLRLNRVEEDIGVGIKKVDGFDRRDRNHDFEVANAAGENRGHLLDHSSIGERVICGEDKLEIGRIAIAAFEGQQLDVPAFVHRIKGAGYKSNIDFAVF